MNGVRADLATIRAIDAALAPNAGVEVVICPPHTLVAEAASIVRHIAIGGQDCHAAEAGPFTGSVSAAMLADAGAHHVILGHSERRRDHGETDADVAAKANVAIAAGLTPIICVGEDDPNRPRGEIAALIARQLRASLPMSTAPLDHAPVVIAYEPGWAIGTDRLPSSEHIQAIHGSLRRELARVRPKTRRHDCLIYGGAVNPDNLSLIINLGINGVLIGRSSFNKSSVLHLLSKLGHVGKG